MTAAKTENLSVVCMTAPLPDYVKQDLAAAFEARFLPPETPLEVLAADPPNALIVTVNVKLNAAAQEKLPPSVRAIGTYSVGLDHIDLTAAKQHGLAVFNTPAVLADTTAEVAIFLMLGAAHRATESIDLLRSRKWPGWNACELNGVQLSGKRLGIYGMGDIGRRIAHRARAMGMTIAYSNRSELSPELSDSAVYYRDPVQMLADIDVLMLAAPSTPQTRGFVNAKNLGHAKPGLMVINIARGDLVVDADLITALSSGHVRAAGLDVFNAEPRVADGYFDLPNVFMTPHIGSSTVEARRGMGLALIDALRAWKSGRRPSNQVC